MKIIILIVSIVGIFFSVIWLCNVPGFPAGNAFIGSLGAFLLLTNKLRKEKTKKSKTISDKDKKDINNLFKGYFELINITDKVPELKRDKRINVDCQKRTSSEQADPYSILSKNTKKYPNDPPEYPNDPHAILSKNTKKYDNPLILYYYPVDHKYILKLRDQGEQPEVISAGLIPFCEEKRELYLHRRFHGSETYPDYLHIYAGGYWPPDNSFGRNDSYSLISTMKREFNEELTGASFILPKKKYFLVGQETDTGFFQFIALGAKIDPDNSEKLESNWEGDPVTIHFDDLFDKLISDSEKWVPSGKAHILTWLALGAPDCANKKLFSGLTARHLYKKVIKKLKKSSTYKPYDIYS